MSDSDHDALESFHELEQFHIDPKSVRLLNASFCRNNYVVILGVVDPNGFEAVQVAMLDPEDEMLCARVRNTLGREITAVRFNAYEVLKAIEIGWGNFVPSRHEAELTLKPLRRLSFDPNQQVTQMVTDTLARAVTVGASDVHIECYEDDVDVRYRIDGILHQKPTPISVENVDAVVARLKILSDLDIAEKRAAQDGRIYASFTDLDGRMRAIDFRLSIVPGPFGEDAVLRILDSAKPLIGLEKLGFEPEILQRFSTLVNNPEGMILVTGPTGSGKTTTLYSALKLINTDQNKVLTAEDPVEYVFRKTNQKQVSSKMSFADYARAFLRQDPDVIMIGEIRDNDTADIAVRAAQTGHLVLSTVHSNDAVGTISRLMTLGVERNMIADTLLGALSQRLVRRICSDCRREVEPDGFSNSIFAHLGERFPVYAGSGCEHCFETGYRGRVGLYELFVMDDDLCTMIVQESTNRDLRAEARRRGMTTLFEDAVAKVREGLTTFDEVHRLVPYRLISEPLRAKL